jgi:phosphonate metabolism-associated iron-containing alcohol dehydrogenase
MNSFDTQNPWTYHNPVKVIFGLGSLVHLKDIINFKCILLVTSASQKKNGMADKIKIMLKNSEVILFDEVRSNPTLIQIDHCAKKISNNKIDCIISLGGGSVIDTAKALSLILANPKKSSIVEYLNPKHSFSENGALPHFSIPTTGGSSSEVTPFLTLWDSILHRKISINDECIFPAYAILDPELTLGLPGKASVSSGLDAISHALESIWNKNSNNITHSLAKKSLELSLFTIERMHHDLTDVNARANMMQASILAGFSISQTKTGLAHSISYPLTANYNLDHGIACSFSLVELFKFNYQFDDGRLDDMLRHLKFKNANEFIGFLDSLFHSLKIKKYFQERINSYSLVYSHLYEMLSSERSANNFTSININDLSLILSETEKRFF